MRRTSRTWLRDVVAAAALGVALAAVALVVRAPHPTGSAMAHPSTARGDEYIAQFRMRLERPAAGPRSAQSVRSDALQAMYLARLETGLGSAFRTIELALRDPLLPDSIRTVFASALLGQTLRASPTVVGKYATDHARAGLVDSVVRSHPDPRRGEEIVRVGFDLAATSGAVSRSEATAAAELAAVARDAAYARRDAARLIAAARKGRLSPIDLLPMWRAERRFELEKPIVYSIAWASSRELVSSAGRLFEVLDASSAQAHVELESEAGASRYGDVAVRLAAKDVAQQRGAPPSPAVLQVSSAIPVGRPGAVAANEEELAGAWLGVAGLTRTEQRALARAVVSAAIRLRTTAQDPVWFAGDAAPRAIELQERHGLRAITFPAGLRQPWREFALLSIDRALTDARRVFPDLDLRGLRIHVGVKADWPSRAMALHDPETRTIYFPLGSGPGVLAHEIGHDLDWQVARSVFGERGIYATDGTARRASEILAAPVERLTGAAMGSSNPALRFSANTRPTEVLARHVDWLVAAALATMGRSNGFLSTVQEGGDALGNTTAPQPGQVDAAVSVVTAATRVPGRTVAEVQAEAAGPPLVRDVMARALATSIRMPWVRRSFSPFDALGATPAMLREAVDPRMARRCMAAVARAAGEPDWVSDVHALVADARARDVMRRLQQAPPMTRRVFASSQRGALAAGPVDPALRARSGAELRRDIEWQLAATVVAPLAQASAAAACLN